VAVGRREREKVVGEGFRALDPQTCDFLEREKGSMWLKSEALATTT
jgi:hypothetical protein